MKSIIKKVSSWTRFINIKSKIYYPENKNEIIELIKRKKNILVCGNFRSYNDVCLNRNLLSLKNFNNILNFDQKLGIINIESGCILADMLKVTLGSNWFIPVSPGTKFVTVGGMIANNIHGKRISKNFFSDHVISFKLIMTNGKIIECSKKKIQIYSFLP